MSQTDDLMLVTAFDQSVDNQDLTILDKVGEIIDDAVKKKNAYIALNACKSLVQISRTSGLGLAKILYLIYVNWEDFGIKDEFESVVYDYVGLHKYTVNKYIRVWGMHQEKRIPEKFEEKIIQRNIRDQIPIANALKQGYKINEKEWDKLANAPDFSEVSRIVREDIKHKPMSVDALRLYLDKNGTIYAYQNNQKEIVGALNIHNENEMVQQAVQRIINNSGILEES